VRLEEIVGCEGEDGRNVGARAERMLGGREEVDEADEAGWFGDAGAGVSFVVGWSSMGSMML
jgi:hypothetical protein